MMSPAVPWVPPRVRVEVGVIRNKGRGYPSTICIPWVRTRYPVRRPAARSRGRTRVGSWSWGLRGPAAVATIGQSAGPDLLPREEPPSCRRATLGIAIAGSCGTTLTWACRSTSAGWGSAPPTRPRCAVGWTRLSGPCPISRPGASPTRTRIGGWDITGCARPNSPPSRNFGPPSRTPPGESGCSLTPCTPGAFTRPKAAASNTSSSSASAVPRSGRSSWPTLWDRPTTR